ncbi:2-dehydro-3-deoxygalactonokinase [Phaeobacter porticola]|uniref:2-dehydro-3-deoxygalactonokinase DgoK n=1 Tax=Phaeobacter porticola TaxID=1844006 RepID=A0A1L3I725_9RHOB|nr:2-dehydro-3-deoxygalactonokinase [Phaeobacter porticola]APG47841.1 2-dehydro-3-deoxygalactonokinase DgoK [Phaeobacter porticola]
MTRQIGPETGTGGPAGPLAWIAADWGTTQLRLWLLDDQNRVLHRIKSDKGMSQLTPDTYEPTLLELLATHLPSLGNDKQDAISVICCGMVGSRQGWAEAPYSTAPCPPPGIDQATLAPIRDPRLTVYLLPGIKTLTPADVMRGEETQIAGFLAQEAVSGSDHTQLICLPGTHSKWARLQDGQVTRFTTFMTGEVFALLQGHSVLRHCVADTGWDDDAFATALSEALSNPAQTVASLFRIRADALLSDQSEETARARLSGLLIGAELAATRHDWTTHPMTILGTEQLARRYEQALLLQGCKPRRVDAETLTLAGLCAARAHLRKNLSP